MGNCSKYVNERPGGRGELVFGRCWYGDARLMIAGIIGAILLFAVTLTGQTENSSTMSGAGYPADWPKGPSRDSVPDWARPGRIRFTCWDGGPLEVAKAFLSGWWGFNPPDPTNLYIMNNWYDLRTIDLLREADFNTIYITHSNGFSIPTERAQQEQVRKYIEACHRVGIHVIAYQSLGNMFAEDMFEKVPESQGWVNIKKGKAEPYTNTMTKMGRITRYMADLSKPGWRDYVLKRVDMAIDDGADGIFYDNCFHPAMGELVTEIQRYANARKPDMLIMCNFHNSDFIFNRLTNSITTEEGGEAGVFKEADILNSRWKRYYPYMLKVAGGLLASNIGRFRIFENLSEGWKPVMLESRIRVVGYAEGEVPHENKSAAVEPEQSIMPAETHQLVLAENMMFSMSNETFVEGEFANGLWNSDPEAIRVWRAIDAYNRFFADNEQYYTEARSLASLAIVLDNRSDGVPLLNGLAARRVVFDILYENELTPTKLKPYTAVALLTAVTVRDQAMNALEDYVANGGKLFAVGNAATTDENGRRRAQPPFATRKIGTGESVYFEKLPPVDDLAQTLILADRAPLARVDAPNTVLYNIAEQPKAGRLILHLLNYSREPVKEMKVTIRGRYTQARLLTPDSPRPAVKAVLSPESVEITTPLKIYSILVLDKKAAGR